MHSSIRIAIVLTLSLIWITQLSFSPVFLSVIFAICIGCLWYFMKSTGNHFPKWAIYILTLVALVVTFGSYHNQKLSNIRHEPFMPHTPWCVMIESMM